MKILLPRLKEILEILKSHPEDIHRNEYTFYSIYSKYITIKHHMYIVLLFDKSLIMIDDLSDNLVNRALFKFDNDGYFYPSKNNPIYKKQNKTILRCFSSEYIYLKYKSERRINFNDLENNNKKLIFLFYKIITKYKENNDDCNIFNNSKLTIYENNIPNVGTFYIIDINNDISIKLPKSKEQFITGNSKTFTLSSILFNQKILKYFLKKIIFKLIYDK